MAESVVRRFVCVVVALILVGGLVGFWQRGGVAHV